MNPADDWSSLAAAWQAQPIDVENLRRSTLRRARRMQLLTALDVLVAAVAIAFAVRFWHAGADHWTRVGIGIGTFALVAAAAISYRLRRGLWRAHGDTVVDLLKLQRARCRNAIRMALWGPLFLPFGLLSGLLLRRDRSLPPLPLGWPPALKLTLIVVLLLALGLGTWLYVRRQRRRIAAIDAHLAQLERS
ncbi:hypothetical protein ACFJIW_19165 [Tahibacter sp. UC22_41]|uniref:hypothetical protein n=1 Tax=Tahibacter sp. UC22_41 TaxID=3350178 RepID=UPI0036D86A06